MIQTVKYAWYSISRKMSWSMAMHGYTYLAMLGNAWYCLAMLSNAGNTQQCLVNSWTGSTFSWSWNELTFILVWGHSTAVLRQANRIRKYQEILK